MSDHLEGLALVLSGGGARAAYQVGFLSALAQQWPDLRFSILTGVSAGAINAAHLASSSSPFQQTVSTLTDLWRQLSIDRVFRVDNPIWAETFFVGVSVCFPAACVLCRGFVAWWIPRLCGNF